MPQRRYNPFRHPLRHSARQFIGRPVYVRVPEHGSAGFLGQPGAPRRSMLAIAYTGIRRPVICAGCIVLTPAERERQRRVFKLARAYARQHHHAKRT